MSCPSFSACARYYFPYFLLLSLLLLLLFNFLLLCFVLVDFSIQVLSSGSWPFQQSAPFSLPAEVQIFLLFKTFTLKKKNFTKKIIERFHLNGNNSGFRPQISKLDGIKLTVLSSIKTYI